MRLLALAVLAAALAAAGPASAEPVGVASGSATFKLTKQTGTAFDAVDLTVGPARYTVSEGTIEPKTFAGPLELKQRMTFRRKGHGKVVISNVEINAGSGQGLTGTIGSKQGLLATLSGGETGQSEFTSTLTGAKVALTKLAAKQLNKALDLKLFKKGYKLGSVTLRATAGQAPVSSGTTSIAVNPSVITDLVAQGGTFAPVAPATLDPTTAALVLPVTGGLVGLDGDQKTTLHHDGGLTISKNGKSITLEDFAWDLGGTNSVLTAGDPPVPVGAVTGFTGAKMTDGTWTAGGLEVRLTAGAEQALKTIGINTPAGTLLGTGSFEVQ